MAQSQISGLRENASNCFQCSKCSAGCPVVEEMDIMPHQVIHSVAIGETDKVLDSATIWVCAGCYTCAVRCPNDINITSVMDDLRKSAVENNRKCPRPEILKFHQGFLKDLRRRGRIHELRFMAEYNLELGKPLNNADVAPKMLLKRRLKILPPKSIKGFKTWSRKIWKAQS